jgi:hypothetical protein
VAWAGRVGRKPIALKPLGEDVMVLRDKQSRLHALSNRCPHRGVPLLLGRQEFPGTWSCWYHGWTYDLESGPHGRLPDRWAGFSPPRQGEGPNLPGGGAAGTGVGIHRRWRRGGGAVVSIRLPGCLPVAYPTWTHFEWYVRTDESQHRYIQLAAKFTTGLDALWFKVPYWTSIRWMFRGLFNDQDAIMVETMDVPPERLYRPDISIIAWRKLCEQPRGAGGAAAAEMRESEIGQFDTEAASA